LERLDEQARADLAEGPGPQNLLTPRRTDARRRLPLDAQGQARTRVNLELQAVLVDRGAGVEAQTIRLARRLGEDDQVVSGAFGPLRVGLAQQHQAQVRQRRAVQVLAVA